MEKSQGFSPDNPDQNQAQISQDAYVVTLKLQYCKGQELRMDKIMRESNRLYDALVEDRKTALETLEKTECRKQNERSIQALRQQTSLTAEERKEQLKPFHEAWRQMLKEAGFTKYAFQSRIQDFRNRKSDLVGSHMAQKTADADMPIVVRPPKTQWEKDALQGQICCCRLIRIPWKDGWLYKVQIVMKGSPPTKKKPNGALKHPLDTGTVGLDIGPQTLAAGSYLRQLPYAKSRFRRGSAFVQWNASSREEC